MATPKQARDDAAREVEEVLVIIETGAGKESEEL